MRRAHTRSVSRSAGLALLAAASLAAQFNHGSATIRGEVAGDQTNAMSSVGLTIQLLSAQDHSMVDQTPTSVSGGFEFTGLANGDYEVQVVDRGGNVLCHEYVRVSQPSAYVTLHMPQMDAARPVSGSVSLSQLGHKVPKKAQNEFKKAAEAESKGDSAKSIQHLQKAIEIDPAYLEAYNNLGARYVHLRHFENALEQFQKGYELDHNSVPVVTNLALTYLSLERYPQAEKAAREVLKLDSTSNKARFVLGLSLFTLQRNDEEAVLNLEAAGRQFPRAYLAAADLYTRRGETSKAAADLRKYLASDDARDRLKVEAWLAELEKTQDVARAR